MTIELEYLTKPASEKAEKVIIWMHGLGADYNDFVPFVKELGLAPTTEVILPNAPIRPITVNRGMRMRGWYDIVNFELREFDAAGTADSTAKIISIYDAKIAQGIAPENILFAGFSQGGAMALYIGTQYRCAGILAMSCYVLDSKGLPQATDESPSILMLHGTQDPIVAFSKGESSFKLLQERGYDVTFKSYPMQHQTCRQEMHDIAKWLKDKGF